MSIVTNGLKLAIMNTLKFTSSIESVYSCGNYTWDVLYPITKIVDDEHVNVINDLGIEECIYIGHFNDGLVKSTKGLTVSNTLETKKQYNFECYTKHPLTGETGWDIKWVGVFATSKEEARELLKSFPDFDCVITFNFGGLELDGEELNLYNSGVKFFERHSYMNNTIIKIYN